MPTYNYKYGVRSLARVNTILSAIAAEEDAKVAYDMSMFNMMAYGHRIQDTHEFIDFINRQHKVLEYSHERMQLIDSKILSETAETRLLESDATKRILNDFNYMKKHGILDKMKKEMLEHRRKCGVK